MTDTATGIESVEDFRNRLRAWLAENYPKAATHYPRVMTDEEELARIQRERELQRMLFDGGFAGICFPKEYGGAGLTPAHMEVFNEEIVGYEVPSKIQVPTFQPCATVLLEFGTEEQKREHLPKILSGERVWMQLLSEPGGGSDVAGAVTTAVRDGDEWIINGSKIWTSGAWFSDWGLCLARTNWDVPKHRGLSVFIFELHQPGIEVQRIEMLDGTNDFCQEFIEDLRIPDSQRIGDVDDGWTIGTRWMFFERSFHSSPMVIRPKGSSLLEEAEPVTSPQLEAARKAGIDQDPHVRQLVGEALTLARVGEFAFKRIGEGMATGYMNNQAAALTRLWSGVAGRRTNTINFELSGRRGAAWSEDEKDTFGTPGMAFLVRQAGEIGGGTTEMSRNVISERVLGMPREQSHAKDLPFREVPRSASR